MLCYLLRQPLGLRLRDKLGGLDAIHNQAQLVGFKRRISEDITLVLLAVSKVKAVIGSKSILITIDGLDIHKVAVLALNAVIQIIAAYRLHTDSVGLVGVFDEEIL